jgi:hypothetical protein
VVRTWLLPLAMQSRSLLFLVQHNGQTSLVLYAWHTRSPALSLALRLASSTGAKAPDRFADKPAETVVERPRTTLLHVEEELNPPEGI